MSSYERLNQKKEEAGSDTLMDFEANQGTAGDENDDFSDSLTAHMERKYLTEQHVDSFINIFGTSPCKVATEKGLELLVLNHKNISVIGDEAWFVTFAKNVTELDLGWNQISSWTVISTLLSSLPSLRRLNLGHNPIEPEIRTDLPTFSRLSTLFVGSMPALNEMHLSGNSFNDLNVFKEGPLSPNVQFLHLNACGFSDWSTVLRVLALFPSIQQLYLVENPIQDVFAECPTTKLHTSEVCKNIRSLSFSDSQLNNWEAIENLAHVGKGKLEDLRLRNIPLLESYSDEERHHLVVGRLRSLVQLNGSPITPFQREESERFFIRYYQCVDGKPPIYNELVERHGNLEQLVKVDLTPRKFAKVMMRCEETNYLGPARIRLASNVLGLMKYASKITSIPVSKMRLFYFDVNVPACGPTELRFPNQVLSSLHIEDGDEFFIQSKIIHRKHANST
ncbi:leucine rich repeat domain-containing protein [Ditylenchus destructor]|nr:leucine rich repeat domain-containing protein [Ditylenchus destructor]